jgi:hypothetical protein
MSQVTSTVIHIPGREATTLTGMDVKLEDATRQFDAAFQTSTMDKREDIVDGVRHIYFSRRTGTKG